MSYFINGRRPHWTSASVARELHVSDTSIRHILRGLRYPSLMLIRRIERVYEWPILEQLSYIPDIGYDKRYADAFRHWLGEQ